MYIVWLRDSICLVMRVRVCVSVCDAQLAETLCRHSFVHSIRGSQFPNTSFSIHYLDLVASNERKSTSEHSTIVAISTFLVIETNEQKTDFQSILIVFSAKNPMKRLTCHSMLLTNLTKRLHAKQ